MTGRSNTAGGAAQARLALATFTLTCCVNAGEQAWDPEELAFLLPLTYSTTRWRADDFGAETSSSDVDLLTRFQPRVHIGPNGLPPVDFYGYYLRQSVVRNASRHIMLRHPTRMDLKRLERTAGLYLDFTGKPAPCRGVGCTGHRGTMYGRVFRETMRPPPGMLPATSQHVVILKYNLVFTMSGLPAGLPWYKEFPARLAGNLSQWHELDIHGAVHVLLRPGERKPFAVILAQHNFFRTYLVGKNLDWPADGHLSVCYAERSNEPYLCPGDRQASRYRATGSFGGFRYWLLGGQTPLTARVDVVYGPNAGAVEIPCTLTALPDKDPLYVSWIPLGDKKRIFFFFGEFYRRGPPGMNMNTLPSLRAYTDIAQFWYMQDGDRQAADLFKRTMQDFRRADPHPLLAWNGRRFWKDYLSIRSQREKP